MIARTVMTTGRICLLLSLLLSFLPSGAIAAETLSSPPSGAGTTPPSAQDSSGLSWNGPDALAAYRKIWNPLSAGPELIPMADTAPPGEFYIRPFFYGQFVQGEYTSGGGVQSLPGGFYETQLLSMAEIGVGLTDNAQFTIFPSMASVWSSYGGAFTDGSGMSDLTMEVKYRFYVQHPDKKIPSMAFALHVTLPTSDWTNAPVVKGGLPPLARIPSTHYGAPAITPALLTRYIAKPYRFYADFFYTYDLPNNGTLAGTPGKPMIQYGDIAQYRLGVEDIADEKTGTGYILEFVGMSGLPFSMDGLPVNGIPVTASGLHVGAFNIWGLQTTFERNITKNLIFSAGVLLPVAGTNQYQSISPNMSLYWYWGPGGGDVVAR
ncbi:MAG: hypothetical protein ACYDBP_02720 [Leptospirales bacterium]